MLNSSYSPITQKISSKLSLQDYALQDGHFAIEAMDEKAAAALFKKI